jgi:nitrite reductase/ring-hydroxylating ferredoxin subunit
MNYFSKITIFLLILLGFTTCNNPENKIPYVYVDIILNLDKPEFSELNAIGNYVYITGGLSGIVVYRDSRNVFFAYERACPYDPECGRVVVEDNGYRLIDTCCGSKFSLTMDGAVVRGPAEMSLRKYTTYYYENSNELRIVSQ